MMGKKDKKKAKKDEGSRFEPYRLWLAGLGAAARAEEGDQSLFDELVERGRSELASRGQKVKKRVRELRDDVREWIGTTREDIGTRIDEQVTETLDRFGVPRRDLVEGIRERLDELADRIHRMEKEQAPPPAPAPAKPAGKRAPRKAARKPASTKAVAGPARTAVKVAPGDSGWEVKVGRARKAVSTHSTKAAALEAARQLARERTPSRLVVHKKDGSVQSETEV
jgi:poly(hydroxyalkanoate) granule-associated protein